MRKILTVVMTIFIVMISGCKDLSNSQDTGYSTGEAKSGSGTLKSWLCDNVVLDYDYNITFPEESASYFARNYIPSENSIDFLFDKTPVKESDKESGLRLDFENCHAIINNLGLVYWTDNGTVYDDGSSFFINEMEGLENVTETKEYDFKKRSDVLKDVKKELNNLGFSWADFKVNSFYSINAAGFDFYKKRVMEIGEAENDEKILKNAERIKNIKSVDYYSLNMTTEINDIPVLSDEVVPIGNNMDDLIFGSDISIIYTQNGIEYLKIAMAYEPLTEKDKSQIISLREAEGLLGQKYSDMFIKDEICVFDVDLIYIPLPHNTLQSSFGKFILEPYYAFSCRQEIEINGEKIPSEYIVYFNAFNGKEL